MTETVVKCEGPAPQHAAESPKADKDVVEPFKAGGFQCPVAPGGVDTCLVASLTATHAR